MRAKIILVLLLLCLFVSGCRSNSTENSTTDIASVQLMEKVSLGLTPEQLLSLLSEAGIQIEMPDYAEIPLPDDVPSAITDGRIYNMTDLSFYYKVKDYNITFTFSYEGSLINISCHDESIPSREGLNVGDSVKTAEKLYGTDGTYNPEDFSVIQYKVAEGYLNVFYNEDTVTGWSLSTYPNINND